MDTVEKIEEYLESIEEYFFSSVSTVTAGFPDVHEAVNRLWVDISRYGPGLPAFPEVHLPTLGDFQVPPPLLPPPPPKPTSWLEKSADWIARHPWKTCGIAFGAAGTCLLFVGFTRAYTSGKSFSSISARGRRNDRRQVVVVLGGDTPFALPLILELERKGYIVITSVSTPEACVSLESKCQGFVRALVLDPSEPATVNVFLRSLTSTLSLRFPVNAAGDPYAPPSTQPYIHSVISLLTLSPHSPAVYAPLEHVSLANAYLPYLTATHITPIRVIQGLLPTLRTGPARSRDKGKKTIIVCLPATAARVGIPFSSVQTMSAASTLRAMEVLRREINLAALTDKSESMKNIKVVVAEVGALKYSDDFSPLSTTESVDALSISNTYKAMEEWTASERISYGPAYATIVHDTASPKSRWEELVFIWKNGHRFGVRRQPTDVSIFVNHLVAAVSGGRSGPTILGFSIGLGRLRNFLRGDRFSVGAGAMTYKMASFLPSLALDALLNLPAFLISVRDRLLPVQPFIQPSNPMNAVPPTAESTGVARHESETAQENDEVGSEGDVESNASDAADSSWIRLHA
ncbi:hypothetical protein AX17_003305 [Amanita inopinata Kibby_2008]|nr:hypothetical protein AX17_003305 [Amanita inopinata Kibby_2008]